jgi:2-phosphoglycerate kinase
MTPAKPMLLAVPPRRAAELWLSIAQAVDAKAAGFSDDLVTRNAAAGTPVSLNRGAHAAGPSRGSRARAARTLGSVSRRVHILGASGSGTTTLAQALAARLGCPHHDRR